MSTTPALVFDGDCGFCTTSAQWLERQARGGLVIVAWQHADLPALGLSTAQCRESVQYVEQGTHASGAAAIARALRHCGWPWRHVGALLGSRPVQPWAQRAYLVVAANRQRLPGGTPACALHGDERSAVGARGDRPGESIAPSLG